MRTVSTDMAAYIASDAMDVWGADLHTFILADGTTIRWSGAEAALTYGSNTWQIGPPIERTQLKYSAGLEVDKLTVWIMPSSSDLIGSTTVRKMAARGDFDGADYRLDRYFARMDNRAFLDVMPMFVGRLGSAEIGPQKIKFPARSQLYLLDQPFPRNVYKPSCGNVLFDGACGLSKAAFDVTGTVGSVASQRSFNTSSLSAYPAGRFTGGRLRFTSGANAGRELQVSEDLGGNLRFARNWPATIVTGDTFIVSPGCDKKMDTCRSKFNNLVRFRGMPFIPSPETTY